MGRPLRAAHSNDAAESPCFSLSRADASLASHIPAFPRTRALALVALSSCRLVVLSR